MARRLAFIDHSFHQKTLSSDFFLELLGTQYEIVRLWDHGWRGGRRVTSEEILQHSPDVILFWQAVGTIPELRKLNRPFIWIPMYDSAINKTASFWALMRTLPVGIVSFCERMTRDLGRLEFDVLPVQYFPETSIQGPPQRVGARNLMIWQRTGIGIDTAAKLIGGQKLDRVVLKVDPDPGYRAQAAKLPKVGGVEVEVVWGHLSKEEYMDLTSLSTIYLAPRKVEGIGMSFLEAMASGAAIVAPNRPTMNEYLEHERTGYLYDLRNPTQIDLEKLDDVRSNGLEALRQGRQTWLKSCDDVLKFVERTDFEGRFMASFKTQAHQWLDRMSRVPKYLWNRWL